MLMPKSSMLIAALKDDRVADYHLDLNEFELLASSPTLRLEADENYIRPVILDLREGLRLDKSDYLLGRHIFIDADKASLKISKTEAMAVADMASVELLAEERLPHDELLAVVEKEEKHRWIAALGYVDQPRLYNRLSSLPLTELQQIEKSLQSENSETEKAEEIPVASAQASLPQTIISRRDSRGGENVPLRTMRIGPAQASAVTELGNRLVAAATKSTNRSNSSVSTAASPIFDLASYLREPKEEPVFDSSGFAWESLDATEEQKPISKNYRLRIEYQFVDGLAYLGPQSQLRANLLLRNGNYRMLDLDLTKNFFFAEIEPDTVGIVMTYQDGAGRLLAHHYQSLEEQEEDQGLKIGLKPLPWGMHIYINGSSQEQIARLTFDAAIERDLVEGVFVDESFTRDSNVLLGIEDKDGTRQLQIIRAGREQHLEFFDAQYRRDLAELLISQGVPVDNERAMLIGRIQGLQDASGFHAELADTEAIGPIYLNDFLLPDARLKESSYSGMFVFVNASPGTALVRVTRKKLQVANLVYMATGALSYSEFPMAETKKIRLELRDAFSEQVLKSQLQLLGQGDQFRAQSDNAMLYTYTKAKALHGLEYQPEGEYPMHRFHFVDSVEQIYQRSLPAFSASALESIYSPDQALLLVLLDQDVTDIRINHHSIDFDRLKLYQWDGSGEKIRIYSRADIHFDKFLVVQGLSAGLHSLQLQRHGLQQNQLVSLSKGFVSLLLP